MTIYERMKVSAAVGMVLLLTVGITSFFVDMSAPFDLILKSKLFAFGFIAGSMLIAPFVVKFIPIRNEQGREFGPLGIILAFFAALGMCVALLLHVVTL